MRNKKAGEDVSSQKLSTSFMYLFYATVKTQKRLLELFRLLFNQNVTHCLAKVKTDTVILFFDAKTVKCDVKFESSSFTLMPLTSSQEEAHTK